MNGVIATSLLFGGFLIFLYTVLPSSAWIGVVAIVIGTFLTADMYRIKILREGLRQYLPNSINEYLTRTDIVDEVVVKLRDNGLVSKFTRLLMIKWLNLSRNEVVEVLSGVWPGFRDLSENKSLVDFAPSWFRRIYAPNKPVIDELSLGDDAATTLDLPSPRSAPSLVPLLLWLAENRVRLAMTETLPRVRRGLLRTLVPLAAIFIIYRTLPKTQRPISHAFLGLFLLYVWSITRGLPSVSETWFKNLGISLYRKAGEKRFKTSQNNGNLQAVMFALIEPFVPIVNTPHCTVRKPPPQSPAMSQASTLEPS